MQKGLFVSSQIAVSKFQSQCKAKTKNLSPKIRRKGTAVSTNNFVSYEPELKTRRWEKGPYYLRLVIFILKGTGRNITIVIQEAKKRDSLSRSCLTSRVRIVRRVENHLFKYLKCWGIFSTAWRINCGPKIEVPSKASKSPIIEKGMSDLVNVTKNLSKIKRWTPLPD